MVPAFAQNLIATQYDWNYTTAPQTGLNGRSLFLPRGHILGGTSSMSMSKLFVSYKPASNIDQQDFMAYTRGSASDYDRFATSTGDPGWSWNNILPYLLKVSRTVTAEWLHLL